MCAPFWIRISLDTTDSSTITAESLKHDDVPEHNMGVMVIRQTETDTTRRWSSVRRHFVSLNDLMNTSERTSRMEQMWQNGFPTKTEKRRRNIVRRHFESFQEPESRCDWCSLRGRQYGGCRWEWTWVGPQEANSFSCFFIWIIISDVMGRLCEISDFHKGFVWTCFGHFVFLPVDFCFLHFTRDQKNS